MVGMALDSSAVAANEEDEAQHRDREPGGEPEPRVQALGDDVPGGVERDAAQEVHAGGMRRGHDEAQDQRVSRGPARADEVRGHDRLAVARLEGVEGAEGRGHEQRDGDDAEARIGRPDELGEAITSRPARAGAAAEDGRFTLARREAGDG